MESSGIFEVINSNTNSNCLLTGQCIIDADDLIEFSLNPLREVLYSHFRPEEHEII